MPSIRIAVAAIALAACHQEPAARDQSLRTTTRAVFYHPTLAAGPALVTRADGSVLDERRYEPFGAGLDSRQELPGGTGPVDYTRDPHNLLGKESDVATGWSDHGARWMDPATARWLTPDPPVKAPDPRFMVAPWALHPYQYVEQNPIAFWDPEGRQPQPQRLRVWIDDVTQARAGSEMRRFSASFQRHIAEMFSPGGAGYEYLERASGGVVTPILNQPYTRANRLFGLRIMLFDSESSGSTEFTGARIKELSQLAAQKWEDFGRNPEAAGLAPIGQFRVAIRVDYLIKQLRAFQVIDPDSPAAIAVLQRAVLHEVGHSIGLCHNYVCGDDRTPRPDSDIMHERLNTGTAVHGRPPLELDQPTHVNDVVRRNLIGRSGR